MKNWFELKYALRVLRKTPGHSSLSVLIVSLSLSIAVVAFTWVYNLFLKPLEFSDGDHKKLMSKYVDFYTNMKHKLKTQTGD